jgi:hypothetical protein
MIKGQQTAGATTEAVSLAERPAAGDFDQLELIALLDGDAQGGGRRTAAATSGMRAIRVKWLRARASTRSSAHRASVRDGGTGHPPRRSHRLVGSILHRFVSWMRSTVGIGARGTLPKRLPKLASSERLGANSEHRRERKHGRSNRQDLDLPRCKAVYAGIRRVVSRELESAWSPLAAESATLQPVPEYRYRDSNPGFRRERAAS